MNKRKDIFGIEPELGDTIVYNPAKHKGLVYGICVGFSTSGLPQVSLDKKFLVVDVYSIVNGEKRYTPKTGFTLWPRWNETDIHSQKQN